jgi:hypothetical protein
MVKTAFYILCILILVSSDLACKAKSCPAYGDDTPERGRLFKTHKNKAKNGLFTKKQRRFYQ